jgi:predicted transglutaminase-like cysteine proteinase
MRSTGRVPLLLACALLLSGGLDGGLPARARSMPQTVEAGPSFVGFPTQPSDDRPAFDFARLDGAPAPEVRAIASAVAGLAPLAQLDAVNDRVNRVAARDDHENYGVDDYWATPQEFFRRGGDCEDYAIAKYAVLERLGWRADQMWLVVMRETLISPVHAVLVVAHDGALWTLDNLSSRVFEHGKVDFYRPSYSVNRYGRWYHGAPPMLAAYRRAGFPSGR